MTPAEAAQFEDHLAACRDCLSFLKTYKATLALTRDFLSGRGSDSRHGLRLELPGGKSRRR